MSSSLSYPANEQTLVMIMDKESQVQNLNLQELRYLFLNRVVKKNNVRLLPILNSKDTVLHEVFLQKVVFMSDRHYQYYLLKSAFRAGGVRIRGLHEIKAWPIGDHAVTYAWLRNVDTNKYKVVTEVWRGNVE